MFLRILEKFIVCDIVKQIISLLYHHVMFQAKAKYLKHTEDETNQQNFVLSRNVKLLYPIMTWNCDSLPILEHCF